MVRNYIRKSKRQNWCVDNLRNAIKNIIYNNLSYRRAVDEYKVPYTTLYDYVQRVKKKEIHLSDLTSKKSIKQLGRFKPVFNESQELELVEYIKKMECRMFGLTMLDLRKLAFDLAEINKIDHNFSPSATSFSVSLRDILRIPHATRAKSTRNIRRGKTAVITDSPYKIELESTKNMKGNELKKKIARKLFDKPQKKKRKCNSSSSKVIDSNDQYATDECIYCTEPLYTTGSKSGEKWARCIGCAKWCHELCGGVENWTSFICDFCRANISKT